MPLTDTVTALPARQTLPAEERFATELAFLAAHDDGPRPPGWLLTPRAVITFVCGSGGEALKLPEAPEGLPDELVVAPKFVGERALVERCVVTLAGERGLLLVGEPGTAKSMLSELLSAAVCGTSALTVQGTAGTTEDALRYGWNYALLLAQGPTPQALVDSPVLAAMRGGKVARVEEITRCLPEVQDALVSILSDRRMSVPELSGTNDAQVAAAAGFTVIATANLRDRGVSEMSAALKRRFNFETVHPIADVEAETELVKRQATAAVARAGAAFGVDDAVLDVLVTVFRDLRAGRSAEGWDVERPGTVMSTAEAVQVAVSLGVAAAYLPGGDSLDLVPGHLLGVVRKDDPADHARLLGYWDGPVRRRAEDGSATWRRLWDLRENLR
ncbi:MULTISPECIES: AAA family ATPase [Streptomyces]|uniref:ATPase n=1 Tax=Streptomyces sviceus (strain ATCC 29083 / DSM 924 / JCM 4929 / NBRC 13980 / NCIMB 11184 / NRRL 5439 / UC 5370) TaxID=463191 RepID=B5HUG6_STRX2|nr:MULTISPECIES: AAA family ATPase [Streptomyces]EDY56471.1 ATPase [Streptomyces sviceus ATCC 29083]MYT10647.1 AAA domain-containing protein [Streptomyces sp. SID5470]